MSEQGTHPETYKLVKSILISQPKPERSPYFELEEKYGLQIDFRQFIQVEGLSARDFRRNRIRLEDYACVIMNSRTAIEQYFRMCEEMRVKVNPDTRYFCLSEAIATYLQHFTVYRKRKVFFGKRAIEELKTQMTKYKDQKFLLPCSNLGAQDISSFLTANGFQWQEAMMYRTVSSDLSDLSDVKYDVLVFFSPLGIQSLFENFPDFVQGETRIAVFGKSTSQAVIDAGLRVDIEAPTPDAPSMPMALQNYLLKSNPQ